MKDIIFLVKLSLIVLAGLGLLIAPLTWGIGLILAIPLVFSLIFGLRPVSEEKRWAIELLGKFYEIAGPGLYWRLPILQKVRQAISVWEQRYPLFAEKPIKIDFINGSAIPKDAFAFVQIIGGKELLEAKTEKETAKKKKDKEAFRVASDKEKEAEAMVKANAYKMIYAITDVKSATIASAENAARSYLNGLTIEQGLTLGRAGYDLITKMKEKEETKADADGLARTLENWGLRLVTVRITDYDLDAAIIKARESVFKAERDAVAAKSRATQKAYESGGTHGAIKQVLVKEYGYPEPEAEKLAGGYVELWKVTEEKALKRTQLQFQGEGGGGFYSEVAKFVATVEAAKEVVKSTQEDKGKEKRRKEEKEEKEEEED